MAVRHYRRSVTVGDVDEEMVDREFYRLLTAAREEAEAIYKLTAPCAPFE